MARILVVDDDPSLLRALRLGLQAGGHEVVVAPTGAQGVSEAAVSRPDAVVLDLGLPDLDGFEVVRRVRGFSDVPIIVLSASGAEGGKVAALDGGANDYMTKPFGMPELQARIRVALRGRREGAPDDGDGGVATDLTAGPLALDLVRREARLDGERLDLTAREFDVLAYLSANVGRTTTHEMVLGAVWGPGYGKESGYLHAYIHRLRQKLGSRADLLETVPGIGYRLAVEPP
jgi:two-component system, OmpR family, KDP operon response regulator KdpE